MSFQSSAAALGLALALFGGAAVPALAVEAYATTNVNVRECADTDCDVVDVLRRGERVDVDYCKGHWCAIDHRGPDGFVHADYLTRDYYDEDDYFDDEVIIIEPRRSYPRRFIRHYDPGFAACVGSPNARFCVYD